MYGLKSRPTEFVDRLNMGYEKKKRQRPYPSLKLGNTRRLRNQVKLSLL